MSVFEDVVGAVEQSITVLARKFPGVVTGKVMSTADPLMLGRVQVRLPFIDALDASPWARVATPLAGMLHGHYFIPDVDTEVLVAFEHGDMRAPYVIGSLWTAMDPPPLQSPDVQIRAIRTDAGNQLVISERPAGIVIQTGAPTGLVPAPSSPTGPQQSIAIETAGIQITTPKQVEIGVNTTKVTVTPSSVSVSVGNSKIEVTPASIDLRGGNITISADGALTLRGSTVLINS